MAKKNWQVRLVSMIPILETTATHLPISLSLHLPISLSPYLPISLSPYLPISLSPYLPISLSPYLPISLSPYLPISPSPHLPISPPLPHSLFDPQVNNLPLWATPCSLKATPILINQTKHFLLLLSRLL
ncbi:MAG: hypothetical protein F6J90_10485 [Moorea sp. SIOASIH]|uniref:hypothetical protein n=1 Tax=Moorena sp. SIOASIH TaxID=2607817 RepID=UPI0013B7FBD3|nr:hypothetical protein [Moorena sp. SIOASIH]NEO36730.1 hypothetical protein [Moorena sp. SIOASIH]